MLKKTTPEDQNFMVTARPIRGGRVVPHSSKHLRQRACRGNKPVPYMGTMRMAGSVQEYRDSGSSRVIGFAHKVAKGRMLWGQWFYCNGDTAMRYVWFHLVRDLERRAIEDSRINVVDLGPSAGGASGLSGWGRSIGWLRLHTLGT